MDSARQLPEQLLDRVAVTAGGFPRGGLTGAKNGLTGVEEGSPGRWQGLSCVEEGGGASLEARYHAHLAMRAAKRMGRTREKQKTSRMICHHLKMMLAADELAVKRSSPARDDQQYRLGF